MDSRPRRAPPTLRYEEPFSGEVGLVAHSFFEPTKHSDHIIFWFLMYFKLETAAKSLVLGYSVKA